MIQSRRLFPIRSVPSDRGYSSGSGQSSSQAATSFLKSIADWVGYSSGSASPRAWGRAPSQCAAARRRGASRGGVGRPGWDEACLPPSARPMAQPLPAAASDPGQPRPVHRRIVQYRFRNNGTRKRIAWGGAGWLGRLGAIADFDGALRALLGFGRGADGAPARA